MKYKVYADDNFHYMDEDERYLVGEYSTYDEALDICKKIVDDYLNKKFVQGMTAEQLYESYTGFGEDPFIMPEMSIRFSAWTYAKQRCTEICDPPKEISWLELFKQLFSR